MPPILILCCCPVKLATLPLYGISWPVIIWYKMKNFFYIMSNIKFHMIEKRCNGWMYLLSLLSKFNLQENEQTADKYFAYFLLVQTSSTLMKSLGVTQRKYWFLSELGSTGCLLTFAVFPTTIMMLKLYLISRRRWGLRASYNYRHPICEICVL